MNRLFTSLYNKGALYRITNHNSGCNRYKAPILLDLLKLPIDINEHLSVWIWQIRI